MPEVSSILLPAFSKEVFIKLEIKSLSPRYLHCSWKNCKKQSKIICNNQNCKKLACKDHMLDLCWICYNNNNPTDITPTIPRKIITRPQKYCEIISSCGERSRIICCSPSCARYVCEDHRHPICADCCIKHISSGNTNYLEKTKFRKNVDKRKTVDK